MLRVPSQVKQFLPHNKHDPSFKKVIFPLINIVIPAIAFILVIYFFNQHPLFGVKLKPEQRGYKRQLLKHIV